MLDWDQIVRTHKEKLKIGGTIREIIPLEISNRAIVINHYALYAVRLVEYNPDTKDLIALRTFPNLTRINGYSTLEKVQSRTEKLKNEHELVYLREECRRLSKNKEQLEEQNKNLSKQLTDFKDQADEANGRITELQGQIDQLQAKLSNQRNILLIGRTGKGKSTIANVLTNTDKFQESEFGVSETKNIQIGQFKHNGIKYKVIDTVGIGDTKLSEQEVLNKIAEAVYAVRFGLSQVLFVTGGRFTHEETTIYEELLKKAIFDKSITRYTTIVRTNFHDFDYEDKCKADITVMKEDNKELEDVISTCHKLIHVNNPPINIVDEELKIRHKEARERSRRILLEHLTENCQDIYRPENLDELSTRISELVKRKNSLMQQINSLKTKGNLNKEEEKELGRLQKEKKEQDEKISEETLEHLKGKGIDWEKAAKLAIQGASLVTGIAGIIVTALCQVM